MNVLLLTADSLRCDRTSLFGHGRDTTPFLGNLAADGFEFRRAYANGRNTAASFPSIHTSTHEQFYEGYGLPGTGTPTLAECLAKSGYATHAVQTNELLAREYNYDRGFDEYVDSRTGTEDADGSSWRSVARKLIGDGFLFELVKRAHFHSTEKLGVKIFDTADAVSGFGDQILNWTTEADDEWFVWAHYMNPHHPYEPAARYQEALGLDPVPKRRATKLSRKMRLHPGDLTGDERDTLRDLYDASVLSWDREVEATYRRLQEAGELADTLVIVTADHGELLGEDGIFGHPPVVKQALVRVPLVFAGCRVESGASDVQTGLIDLAPTVLSLADCSIPDSYRGRSLFDGDGGLGVAESTIQLCETGDREQDLVCAVSDDSKVVYDRTDNEWTAYRLSDNALTEDATEAKFAELRDAIRTHLDAVDEERTAGAAIDEESLREDLSALGYLNE